MMKRRRQNQHNNMDATNNIEYIKNENTIKIIKTKKYKKNV